MGSTCALSTTDENSISLSAPTVGKEFASTDRIAITINSITTPDEGLPRDSSVYWDFDASNSEIWTVFNAWTNKYELFFYDTDAGSQVYTSKSYGVVSANYKGFNPKNE
jgi:dipeptidyl aminopeptidase/acylaminoacyl peptidase